MDKKCVRGNARLHLRPLISQMLEKLFTATPKEIMARKITFMKENQAE